MEQSVIKTRFIETIAVKDGEMIADPELHITRMEYTCRDYGMKAPSERVFMSALKKELKRAPEGLCKCTVIYTDKIEEVHICPYLPRKVSALIPVRVEWNPYPAKLEDRSELEEAENAIRSRESHAFLYGDADAPVEEWFPLFILNDQITDTSFSSVVVETKRGKLLSPLSPLMMSTRRLQLIYSQQVELVEISLKDIIQARRIHLVNAMLPLGACVVEATNSILPKKV